MNYVGIDHHRQYSHMTLMDQEGQVLRSGRVPNLRAEIEKFLEGGEAMEAVIETGRSSYTMVDVLEEMGVAVKIAHPNEVKAIARAKIKTDKRGVEGICVPVHRCGSSSCLCGGHSLDSQLRRQDPLWEDHQSGKSLVAVGGGGGGLAGHPGGF